MHRVVNVAVFVAAILVAPAVAFGQATIAGVVRDASAAVLPGVTVEASSSVLIEKTRTVVSDGTGQYRLTDLPPGNYTLTFSLSGFATVKREGLAVSGSGVTQINMDLHVGALAETVTVSGEAPLVDTQTVRREVVLNNETLNTLPATRGYGSALAAVPALSIGGVAGANAQTAPTTPSMTFFTAHGGASGEGRLMTNGLTVAAPFGGGGVSDVTYDIANADEMQVLISGGLGRERHRRADDQHRAEVRRQPVPRRGVLQHIGQLGDREQSRRLPAQRRHHAAAGAQKELGRERQRRRSDREGSSLVFLERPQLGERGGGRRHLREPLRRRSDPLGLRPGRVDRGAQSRVAHDLRRPRDGAAQPAQQDHVLARLPAPLRRIVAEAERRRLPPGWNRLGRLGADVRRRHGVARIVPGLPQLPLQHDAGHVFGAHQQPHAARRWLLAVPV